MSTNRPKVSVCIITYNHEKFIAQAIESVPMQEVDLEYEIIIGDDCSTDATREIVTAYHKKYPDIIRPLLPPENVGMHKNLTATLKASRGEYLALLEGDDYWTDPTKLQKQVDFLESHRDCAICCHDLEVKYEDNKALSHRFCPTDQRDFATLDDFLLGYSASTPSIMFRNGLIKEFPDWFFQMPIGDVPLIVLILLSMENGRIGYINEAMGVHRVHEGGIWSSRGAISKESANIEVFQKFIRILPAQYKKISQSRLHSHCYRLGVHLAKEAMQAKFPTAITSIDHSVVKQKIRELNLNIQAQRHLRRGLYKKLVFQCRQCNRATVLRLIIRAVLSDPRLLYSLGVWSAGVQVFFGTRFANWLRLLYQGIRAFTQEGARG